MSNFIFQNGTKIYFGENQLNNLAKEIKVYGTKVLLCYGGGSIKKIGLYDKVIAELKSGDIEVYELSGIEPNPRHTTVNKGAKLCKQNKVDLILAVGGGSTIDCAKAIAAAANYDGDAWDLVIHKAEVTKALPIISILTLSATGSEMDAWSVISNMDTHEKYGFNHKDMLPKVSFLDPTNTYSVSAYQTASGSADILSHIFDSKYFTLKPKLEMIDMVMELLIKTVIKFAPIAIKEPNNYEARANLMWASSWALNGFINCGINHATSCHAMEHELSAYYDITHGHGLAILTPRWLEYVLNNETAPVIYKFGKNCFGIKDGLSEIDGAKASIKKLSDFLFNELGLASRLSDLNIDETHFKAMANNACKAKGGVIDGFVKLTPEDVENIYKMCL